MDDDVDESSEVKPSENLRLLDNFFPTVNFDF